MDLLLDSHALLWAIYEPEKLSDKARTAIADRENSLFVSHAAVWEIGNKAMRFGLPLLGTGLQPLLAKLEGLDVKLVPIEFSDILLASSLEDHHRDPFDRMMIAQAVNRGLTLLTHDVDIAKYAVELFW